MVRREVMRAARMASSRVKGAWLGGGVGVRDGSFEGGWEGGGGPVGDMVVGGAWVEICQGCGRFVVVLGWGVERRR